MKHKMSMSDKLGIEIIEDMLSNESFVNDFNKASKLSLRIIESICEDDLNEFRMDGSSAAVDFVNAN